MYSRHVCMYVDQTEELTQAMAIANIYEGSWALALALDTYIGAGHDPAWLDSHTNASAALLLHGYLISRSFVSASGMVRLTPDSRRWPDHIVLQVDGDGVEREVGFLHHSHANISYERHTTQSFVWPSDYNPSDGTDMLTIVAFTPVRVSVVV